MPNVKAQSSNQIQNPNDKNFKAQAILTLSFDIYLTFEL
jgi:hypothetical protein